MDSKKDIYLLAKEKILLGRKLIEQLSEYKSVAGVQKIQRKIGQEVKFLEKVTNSNTLVINHVMCSNLTHYEFLINVLVQQKDVVHVDCAFYVENKQNPIRVDIVCNNGAKWVKVIARNSKSISDAAKGGVSFGVKSIIDQAEEYARTAEENLYMFKKPQVMFYFSHNIDSDLLEELHKYGILTVTAQNKETMTISTDENCSLGMPLDTQVLNLDITTLLAYVSALTNGNCHYVFQEPLLSDQAVRERELPLKPILDQLFEGKRLICCNTAVESFKNIISILGGPSEKERADLLLAKLNIMPDLDDIPKELCYLELCGKIKPRSLKIFAFGLFHNAVTVTSNEGFIRSARMKGINVPVFIHQARALTESKENEGKELNVQ